MRGDSVEDPTSKLRFVGNRFSRLFEKAIDTLEPPGIQTLRPVVLTYWDTYYGPRPPLDGVLNDTRILELIDKKKINPLANKRKLPELLAKAEVEHVAPVTYASHEAAMAHVGGRVPIWFFKNVYGTGGKDMFCVASEDLGKTSLPKNFVIQAGVQNLALIDDKKFTTRVYVMIWDGRLFFYENGFLMIHAAKYESSSADYEVQIDHSGYAKPGSAVKMQQLVNYSEYNFFAPKLRELIQTIAPIFSDAKAAAGKNSYILLGIDTLLQANGDVQLIEVNTFPNFVHTTEIIDKVNVPFFKSALLTMLGTKVDSLVEL